MNSLHTTPVLEIRDLCLLFPGENGPIRVVDGINLTLPRGKTVAVVGESGCGKSLTALAILRLLPPGALVEHGQVLLHPRIQEPGAATGSKLADVRDTNGAASTEGPDLAPPGVINVFAASARELRRIRGGRVAMVFQEPQSALNPVLSIGDQIVEAIRLHSSATRGESWALAIKLLKRVGIAAAEERIRAFPHQLSGGMRQRAMIAMALACGPDVLIADEPTTALDVTVQAQVLELLKSLQRENGLSILLVTHDLGVVARVADEVYVMYAGRFVEKAPVRGLFERPRHPYTRGLLRCTPRLSDARGVLGLIPGSVARPGGADSGCRFAPRCDLTRQRARDSGRITVRLDLDFPGGVDQRDNVGQVLRRCVDRFDAEESGVPPLVEWEAGHFAACWEAASNGAPRFDEKGRGSLPGTRPGH